MEKNDYSFELIRLSNRLGMDFDIDVRLLLVENEQLVIVRANRHHHRSSVAKNMEHIAFQLRAMFTEKNIGFSIVEYRDRSNTKETCEEWWQWRFRWVGNTALDGQCYALSTTKAEWLKCILLNKSLELKKAS
ncbi:MAG: hypothetical protein ACI9D5_000791 [Candidatus Endobugula sp.]